MSRSRPPRRRGSRRPPCPWLLLTTPTDKPAARAIARTDIPAARSSAIRTAALVESTSRRGGIAARRASARRRPGTPHIRSSRGASGSLGSHNTAVCTSTMHGPRAFALRVLTFTLLPSMHPHRNGSRLPAEDRVQISELRRGRLGRDRSSPWPSSRGYLRPVSQENRGRERLTPGWLALGLVSAERK
jgi:hypothetical protein